MTNWNEDDQLNDGAGGEQPAEGAGMPPVPPELPTAPGGGMNDFGGGGYDDVDEKVAGGGNRGMLIVFLLLLVIGGVIAFLWYRDHVNHQKWNEKFQEAVKLENDEEFKAALRTIMDSCERQDILAQVAFELGVARDAQAVTVLTRSISKGGELAEQAALALARINTPEAKVAADAIHQQMLQTEELRQAKFAWALVSLGDDRGFPTLLEAVSRQIANTRTIPGFSAEVVSRMGTTDKLIEMAEATDPMLRMYAAMELGFRDDLDPVPALLKLLEDDNPKVSEAAAVSLGRTGDDRAGAALLAKVSRAPDMLSSILSSVSQSVGSPGLEAIYNNTTDPAIKYTIVGRLKTLNDPRSSDLLLRITEESFPGSDDTARKEADEIRNQALWTLEKLGEKRIADKMFAKTEWEPISPELIPDDATRYRQDDMSRRIANGVVSWFGEVQPDGVADYLMRMYRSNEPYTNSPETARRVKVDIGPLMDAMGRTGDERFCPIVDPFLTKDDGFFSQAAFMALGRLGCKGTMERFRKAMVMSATERKEGKFSTLEESRNWQMEERLQERRNAIIASRFLGNPAIAETLMAIILDPVDDPELRTEAADSLAYVADDAIMQKMVENIVDDSVDPVSRTFLVKGLWHNSNAAAQEAIMNLLEGNSVIPFIREAAIVMGEASNPVFADRLNNLLDHTDENRRRAAVLAILLGGNLERMNRILEILEDQESLLVLRGWYTEHPVFLTEKLFSTKRVYNRLRVARELADRTAKGSNLIWPWKHLTDRLDKGWDTSPGAISALRVRQLLATDVQNDPENAELAASILRGMNERGYLLALQAGEGDGSRIARETLNTMNRVSE
jgi:HEAT repeat protein